MLLAIDAGNTNVVFALVEGGEIKARWRIATDPAPHRRRICGLAAPVARARRLSAAATSTQVIIGTVVPRALHNLEVLARNISA